jgi:hypothetical protein
MKIGLLNISTFHYEELPRKGWSYFVSWTSGSLIIVIHSERELPIESVLTKTKKKIIKSYKDRHFDTDADLETFLQQETGIEFEVTGKDWNLWGDERAAYCKSIRTTKPFKVLTKLNESNELEKFLGEFKRELGKDKPISALKNKRVIKK